MMFSMYFLAVTVAAWAGGIRPAMVTAILCSILANYLFSNPRGHLEISNTEEFCGLIVFLSVSLLIGVLCEISLKSMARARAAEQQKDDFLAILAHELRNPLAPIRNGLQVMRMAADQPAMVARVRDMMERQVTQMIDLVDDLLDIARITRGNLDLKLVQVDARDVIASAVETSMPLIEASRHELVVDTGQVALPLHVDATRIAQVIGNVLNNAAKYTPAGGRIAIQVDSDDAQVHIAISDNGIGIPPEAADSVFDMFSQVGASIDRAQGGLGIGLSLARRLLDLHGGSIALASRGSGHGSTFHIRIPLAAPAGAASQADVPAENPGLRRLRVMIVDDNADAADMLSTLIDMVGHTTRVANDGRSALALAAEFLPDVAFLDIGMPGMNGYQLAENLRRMPGTDRLILIALTGWGDPGARARSKEAGFDHHLIKPTDLEVVQALLTDIARTGRPPPAAPGQP
jgi:signal transduction histidine kinase/CheY-like chemotaxis protein